MRRQLLLLELNEVNFEHVSFYCSQGALPNLAAMLRQHGVSRTVSEDRYDRLEPWIQWVTAHTGLTFAQHQVYRLGDIVRSDIPQIWERLEDLGLRVGAISPMNAKHRLRNPDFFVPDPWTSTGITARPALRTLYNVIAQAVNENAKASLTAKGAAGLIAGWLMYARPAHYAAYVKFALSSRACPWRRAMFLDLLLADVFLKETARSRPDFASLFLNAAAHIQHHYMFCSAAYDGPHRNPKWYVHESADPVREVYELYDRIVARARRDFPQARIMLATGLHQDPHGEVTYYWRPRDHANFMRRLGVHFERVEALMSRDFLVVCADAESARRAAARLEKATAQDGEKLFEVDNRGTDLFVMFTYAHDIPKACRFFVGEEAFDDLREEVVFVAIKNGEHNGIGYFVDSGVTTAEAEFPLHDLPNRIVSALSLTESRAKVAA
jgi:hypothetical protein